MDLGLRGRTAVVNGASRGLGRAVAIALGSEGADLVITARDSEALAVVEKELTELGSNVVAIAGDITEEGAPDQIVTAALERFGRIDVLVVNGGGPARKGSLEVGDAEIIDAVNENLLTPVRFVRAALPHMRAARFGRICFVASYGVVQPLVGIALSNTARTGLYAWAKTAAHDLRGSGVTINLACPGPHPTGPQRNFDLVNDELGDPDDFGRIVAFLCSESARYLNGQAVVVDGGRSLAL